LDIAIGGTTAGTKYDQLNVSGAASLKGTLNLSLIGGFVPTVGSTFEILNAGSVTGTFSTVKGTSINGSEHFVVSCDTTDCDVTVASGAFIASNAKSVAPQSYAVTSMRNSKQSVGSGSRVPTLRVGDSSAFGTSTLKAQSFTNPRLGSGAASFRAVAPVNAMSGLFEQKPLTGGANAGFRLMPKFTVGPTQRNSFAPGPNFAIRRGSSSAPTGLARNGRVLGPNGFAYKVDLLSLLGIRRSHDWSPYTGSVSGSRFGSLIISHPD
jgi:hypothetical protein